MTLENPTLREQTLIVNNVVRACYDIQKLSEQGYKFISLSSGFIAHFNRFCFTQFYREDSVYSLREDILKNAKQNEWNNFRPGDTNYEYYMYKAATYATIVFCLKHRRHGELKGTGALVEHFNQVFFSRGKVHKVYAL